MHQIRLKTQGLDFQVFEAGQGPLVLLLHGFTGLGYSWRHQIPVLAEAGFRVIAPDLRGSGGTISPADSSAYGILDQVGDLVDLLDALEEPEAFLVGHGHGAHLAYTATQLRPDLFPAVAALSMPFVLRRREKSLTATLEQISQAKGEGEYYLTALKRPGFEALMDADPASALKKIFSGWDGATPHALRLSTHSKAGTWLIDQPDPERLPAWLNPLEFEIFVETFTRTGFKGTVDSLRALDSDWQKTRFMQDQGVEVPALYMVGENDPLREDFGEAEADLPATAFNLVQSIVVPGAGHWLAQDTPHIVNDALIGFFETFETIRNFEDEDDLEDMDG